MRILHVTNNYTPYNGGVVHAINTIITSQIKEHVVGLVTFDFKSNLKYQDQPFVYRIWSPLHFTYKNNPMILPYNIVHQLAQIIINFKPTIIHTHHPFLLGWAAQKIGHQINCPVVFTYHTWYTHYTHYSPYQGIIVTKTIQKTVNNFCKKVDGIIAPSKAIFNLLQKQQLTNNYTIIPSPIADRFFKDISPKKPCHNRKIRLLSLSRFTHEKNLFALFNVCQFLKTNEFELIIAGFGYLENELQKIAYQKYKFSPTSVRFILKPSITMIDELYDWADLFLFMSQSDTQGLVLAEALARATPVLCLEGPGQKDIIKNGFNGFYTKNSKEMAFMIKKIHTSKILLNFLSKNGLQTSKKYNKEIISSQITNFYQECLTHRT